MTNSLQSEYSRLHNVSLEINQHVMRASNRTNECCMFLAHAKCIMRSGGRGGGGAEEMEGGREVVFNLSLWIDHCTSEFNIGQILAKISSSQFEMPVKPSESVLHSNPPPPPTQTLREKQKYWLSDQNFALAWISHWSGFHLSVFMLMLRAQKQLLVGTGAGRLVIMRDASLAAWPVWTISSFSNYMHLRFILTKLCLR